MEHLALEIFDLTGTGSKYAALPENTVITVTDTSEIFASGDVWTHQFTLNARANAHILGSAAELHGARLHEQLHGRRARLWAEGLPLYMGYLKLGDEAEVDSKGNIDVTLESGHKTFEEMVSGAKANQVPMMSDVMIGMALWRKRWTHFRVKLEATARVDSGAFTAKGDVTHSDGDEVFDFSYDGEEDGNSVQEYPRMVYPKGHFASRDGGLDWNENCLNTDWPYDEGHPYCNVALCYQKYGYVKKDQDGNVTTDYGGEPEAQRGYEYMPADRVNSAPNFFVIYWIKALMKHIGIYIEENQMEEVEDLRRLFFVNTKCAYEEPRKLRSATDTSRYGRFRAPDGLVPEYTGEPRNVKMEESGFAGYNIEKEEPGHNIDSVSVKIREVEDWRTGEKEEYLEKNNYFHKAYATSECFPDVDIQEVVKALEDGFGIRFLFSDDYQRVRIVLLRNVFRSGDVQHINCDVVSDSKVENNIRGFRMSYGDSKDSHFYYKGLDDLLPVRKKIWKDNTDKHDYSHWDLDAEYSDLIHKVSAFDKTCYVTPETGNAYGIKVDKDAKRYDELHPSLFEFAGFMDACDGDCTGEDETVKTITVGFKPAIMNDLDFEKERDDGTRQQRFALFIDKTMRPRRVDLGDGQDYNDPTAIYSTDKLFSDESPAVNMKADGLVKPGEFSVASDMYAYADNAKATVKGALFLVQIKLHLTFDFKGHIFEGYHLYLQDNYEPNDEGVCPVEQQDWGLMLGIMRGSGSDAYVNYEADPDDGEGNDTWDIVPGTSVTAHPDTCDSYGKLWDYNGSVPVYGGDIADVMREMWPESNINLVYSSGNIRRNRDTYISYATIVSVEDYNGQKVNLLFATGLGVSGQRTWSEYITIEEYAQRFRGVPREEMYTADAGMFNILIEVGGTWGRVDTLLEMQRRAFYDGGQYTGPMELDDNGVGSKYGRFSLKLRAEKLNPYFDESQPETHYDPAHPELNTNPRYLHIDNDDLQGRGLKDYFYKEYSYWVRNARIAKRELGMGLADLLALDKTKRVEIGDILGFICKTQYSISKKSGLGHVTAEIMYI